MNKNSTLFKASLLSISLIVASGPAISSLIPLIQESFPDKSTSAIELIATVPNFGILIFVLLSNFVIKVIGKKQTVLAGLSLALISGLFPVFIDNYTIILVSRFLFGAGIGLFNALAVSLITDLYDGEQQASLMGLQGAMGSIGSTILTFAVGYFTKFGWQNSFLVYAITVIPLVLFGLIVKIPDSVETSTIDNTSKKEKINGAVITMMIFALIVFALFFVVMLKTASLMVEKGIGQPEIAANILSSITIVGILVGLFYGQLFKRLKQWVLPIGLVGMGIGFFIILFANSVFVITLGTVLSGLFYSLAAPYMFMLVGKVAPENSSNLATSILLIGINLGVFLSPSINGFLGKLFGITNASGTFLVNGVALVCLGVLSFILLNWLNRKNQMS